MSLKYIINMSPSLAQVLYKRMGDSFQSQEVSSGDLYKKFYYNASTLN